MSGGSNNSSDALTIARVQPECCRKCSVAVMSALPDPEDR